MSYTGMEKLDTRYEKYKEWEIKMIQQEVEEELRKNNPGLQEAWEKYQLMLKLVQPAKVEPKNLFGIPSGRMNVIASSRRTGKSMFTKLIQNYKDE